MKQYSKGLLVATELLPRKNNMHYQQYGDMPIYCIYSYNTAVGYYDGANNVIVEWAKLTHYSVTTSKQMTTLCNYMEAHFHTRRMSVDLDNGITLLRNRLL